MNDEELTKLAEAELLKEAQRAAARAEIIGPEGWRKCPSRNVNKRFLVSTIRDAIYTNKRVKFKHTNVYYRDSNHEKNENKSAKKPEKHSKSGHSELSKEESSKKSRKDSKSKSAADTNKRKSEEKK